MSNADAAIIGGGVVGLACAVALARRGKQVLVLEAGHTIGTGTSSRNSEVIHAGIYYPEGSLKARLCVEGCRQLYAFCRERNVPHRQTGKIIFTRERAQTAALHEIAERGQAAGVDDLRFMSRSELDGLEPDLRCERAVLSPSTGIVDSHALMLALEGELTSRDGQVVCNTTVQRVERTSVGWAIHVEDFAGAALTVPLLVNSAGLHATFVAAMIEGLDAAFIPEPAWARGCYFSYERKVPFRHLIYPVPVPGGLGTHLTLDLAGRARFGPNVQWVNTLDYSVDPALHEEFLQAARQIWSGTESDALHPAYAGIRPKVRTAAGLATDFIISDPSEHKQPGLVNLFGIESPGLTASLPLGEEVARRLEESA